MAATVQTNSTEISPDINTTPLIDVMLVLLTLLIMTLPMQTHAIKIDTGPSDPAPPLPTVVDLAVQWDGTTSWNGVAVDRKTLDAYLADAARKSPQPAIVIKADRLVKYDAVARVLSDANRAGETHIGFDQTDVANQ
ncbi:MAG: biopolymer transporter ExbD [Alphaproteobacteria bacterium]|nr:biopolymer transporter ExbD [Alphaproteobacteria bacterium]